MRLLVDRVESPIGTILIVVDGNRLCALDYADCEERMLRLLARRYGEFRLIAAVDPLDLGSRVRAYFRGDLAALADAPIETGGTPFQQRVWEELRRIPTGSVLTYGEVAGRLGRPGSARAVGRAVALNPVAIAIPCHRVVGAHANLTGYAGGLERKRWLLKHEGATPAALRQRQTVADSC